MLGRVGRVMDVARPPRHAALERVRYIWKFGGGGGVTSPAQPLSPHNVMESRVGVKVGEITNYYTHRTQKGVPSRAPLVVTGVEAC